ncbi:alpha/beta hydrolase [Nocardia sp. 348MFTsu5.1]|uniref:alpha/beta hydrolase n=1 Tax=Nocardia sp. 348MFTsu5.1 TaxID=1172185 RepID=UPI000372AD46|nr:alpha/beta hydrolase [Nocardia sp. 348MFTsu5.1]
MTTLEPEVAAMLEVLNNSFPDVTTMDPAEVREVIRGRRAPLTRQPDMQTVTDLVIDGPGGDLALRVFRPHDPVSDLPVVVFAHGGGFVFCDLDSHDEFCRSMAEGVGVLVVSVDYRLAPEHPGPAAFDDVYAALEWSAEHAAEFGGDGARLIVAGDSAGGNLAATVAIAARDRSGPSVAGQVLIYPVIDDDFETESYRRFGAGYYNTTSSMKWYWQQYAPHGTDDARLVPTRTKTLAGLPDAIILTAELDPPCSAGDDYAARLASSGVPVTHHRFDGLFHGFLTFPSLPQTEPARRKIWALMERMIHHPHSA